MKKFLLSNGIELFAVANVIVITLEFTAKMPILGVLHIIGASIVLNQMTSKKSSNNHSNK